MKKINKKKVILCVAIFLAIVIICLVLIFNRKTDVNKEQQESNQESIQENNQENILENIFLDEGVDKNQIEYQPNTTVDEIKNEIGATGNTDIYQVEQEYDGRNIITVKPSIKYKVAFAGMIKNAKPSMNELDNIVNEKLPNKAGIWIEEQSRDKILKMFNGKNVNSKYSIDQDGYLKIDSKNEQNDIDKKIEKIINGNKQYVLDISSVCYIVDDVTGEILDYNFENMDKYQTYEYFEDNDRVIVFVTENLSNVLTESEIFESLINLF